MGKIHTPNNNINNFAVEYRRLTPEEKLYVARMQGIVFGGVPNEKEIRDKIEKGEYDSEHTYGAVEENGRVVAGMDIIPYTMWFDGHKVPMYGIAGVASMPESRRQGNVRGIFAKVLEDIYEKGAVFSHLYPFSYDYYRKFGYENCGSVKRYTLPLEPARRLKNSGTPHEFINCDKCEETAEIRGKLIEIYENYASRHNMMLSRTPDRWNEVFDVPLFSANHLYYWKNAECEIKSWVKFKKKNEIMEINDIAWSDNESMLGILQFMGMFDGAAEKLTLRASPEFLADLYWNDLYDIGTETHRMGMNCVVNAKRALELLKKPRGGEGRFTIKIEGAFSKWNNNTYAVEYGGDECTVKEILETTPDIITSEHALLQMILGSYEFELIAQRNDVQINGDMLLLKQVFYKKKTLLADYF